MIDRRLWQRAAAMRRYVVFVALVNAAATGLIIVQALLVAGLVADLATDGVVEPGRLQRELSILLGVALGRAVLAWAQERFAVQAAGQVIADLRRQVVNHVVQLGPRWGGGKLVETAIAATQGLDALEPYLVRYLPALLLTALVTPAALLVIGGLDWIALAIVLVALPLVPLFMWLIGTMTAGTSQRRLAVVSRLGAQVLDLLTGLPTLRAFGREIGPGARVKALGDASRAAAMGTLRIAFLSSMVLELLTTIAVAMVAVSVGLRLVAGAMPLRAGMAVIMLAPEVFNPLRQVAAQFHASTDGVAATQNAYQILDHPLPSPSSCGFAGTANNAGSQKPKDDLHAPPVTAIELGDVSVLAGDRDTVAPANLSARIETGGSGRIVALVGPSGSGKSTTALLLLGLLQPDQGSVIVQTADGETLTLAQYGLENWWRQLMWIPQRPALEGRQRNLSIGQRQRIALQTALQAGPEKQVLILDEPTAHLDAASEQSVLDTLTAWRAAGKTAIVIAHRPSFIRLANQVAHIHSDALSFRDSALPTPRAWPQNDAKSTTTFRRAEQ